MTVVSSRFSIWYSYLTRPSDQPLDPGIWAEQKPFTTMNEVRYSTWNAVGFGGILKNSEKPLEWVLIDGRCVVPAGFLLAAPVRVQEERYPGLGCAILNSTEILKAKFE